MPAPLSLTLWVRIWVTFMLIGHANTGDAQIFYGQQEAMALAFGAGAEVLTDPLYLTPEQIAEVEKVSHSKLDTELFTFYSAERQGAVYAYAAIDSHTVRSQSESIMVVLNPRGEVTNVVLLAFNEPPEYRMPDRWMALLAGKSMQQLALGQGVDAITGATLTSRAMVASVRRVKALFTIAHPETGAP